MRNFCIHCTQHTVSAHFTNEKENVLRRSWRQSFITNMTSNTTRKKTPPTNRPIYKHLRGNSVMSTVSLLLSCAVFNSNYTEAVKTLNQHVNLRNKNKRFLGCSNTMLLCRSDVLSWSLQEFSLCVLITTSKHSPECIVCAFRGISSSIVIPHSRLHGNIPKGKCPMTCWL